MDAAGHAAYQHVDVPLVAIVHFRDGKLAYEHIYWDKASILKQICLLTGKSLPGTVRTPEIRPCDNQAERADILQRETDRIHCGMSGKTRLLLISGLLAMLVFFLALAWVTRDALVERPILAKQRVDDPNRLNSNGSTHVDLRPWQTAHALAGLASTPEEKEFAAQAERFADHEVDLAFASALRQASLEQRSLTGEALALSQRVEELQQVVNDDKTLVQSLTDQAASSNVAAAEAAGDDLDVTKAQLALDSDLLADAQQDLARAGGMSSNT